MKIPKVIWFAAGGALLLLIGFFVVTELIQSQAQVRVDGELDQLRDRIDVQYEGFRYAPLSGQVAFRDLTAKTGDGTKKLSFRTLTIAGWERDEEGTLTDLQLKGTGMRLHLGAETGGEWEERWQGPAANQRGVDFSLDCGYEPQGNTVDIRKLVMEQPDLADVELVGQFADARGLDWNRLRGGNLLQIGAAFGSLKIAQLKIDYTDLGLIDDAYAREAEQSGRTTKEVSNGVFQVIEEQKTLRLTQSMKT
ncbi:MAG: hypothetical protein AAGJ31_13040, partial [Verrucomicrobiota bacterium]